MQDFPSSNMFTSLNGNKLKKLHKDINFELRLTAIEENSGHMIVLSTIEWGKSIILQYDSSSQEMNSRLKLNHLSGYCKFKRS